MRETFCKDERLCSKRLISLLFEKGEKRFSYPFRITTFKIQLDSGFPAQLLISVPRSLFKNACDRNKIKRLIREAYRKHKYILYDSLSEKQEQMLICMTYISKEIVSYQIMTEKIIVLLLRFKEEKR